ncbi:hypothetical protein DNTS_026302 [Danionella cerebrum]|uniref:Protein phosphatase 1 regulatory subunit 15A/B C-terminal domain-containing protein n=1 Tax=Danionella cerebrum TaxID=2873325 RepID=A0A553RI47_9TELE|nr:hypothetical protein DNTS_026302 [Danionella translucida]
MSTQRHFFQGDTRPPRDGDGRADSSWISVFSLVSRPAWSFLQKYFSGRTPHAFDLSSHLEIGNSLAPLNVAYLQCQHDSASRVTPGDPGALAWFTQESLSELGIQSSSQEDFTLQKQTSVGYLGAERSLLSQVLLNTQDKRCAKPEGKYELCLDAGSVLSTTSWWQGGFLDDGTPNFLLNVKQSRTETDTSWQHCEEHHSVGYCQSSNENAGPLCSKELAHNALRHMPNIESLSNSYQLPVDVGQQLLVCSSAFSEVAIVTSDQDNGYSSLEEEHLKSKLHMKLLSQELVSEKTSPSPAASEDDSSQSTATETEHHCENLVPSEDGNEQRVTAENTVDRSAEGLAALATPQCQNKVISYIMGSPCSDESEDEDDGEDWDSNDDDGFDSEGSSHVSESENEDSDDESEEDSDEEDHSETERLWNALCQTEDPYNPRNFTAPLRTSSKPSSAATDSSISRSPPALMSMQPSPSPSSPSFSENESSEETCEMDEEENCRLWNSFRCVTDPYSLLNFQAPIQTQDVVKGSCKEKAPGVPRYNRQEAEERLDSGFSEISPMPCTSSATALQLKKVTFVEEVEEFYASSDEDRHGPWEELARDRCRFQRRVQEVEESISFCFSPTFRLDVFQRLFSSS